MTEKAPDPAQRYQAGCCLSCITASGSRRLVMVVCSVCGNKRCPKATNHENKCTGSNEPGQKGSVY